MILLVGWMLVGVVGCSTEEQAKVQDTYKEDLEQVKQLRIDFQEHWIVEDSSAVMNLMTDDIVFQPHHGDSIIIGREALATYWFNPNYPATDVLEYTEKFVGAHVSGEIGYSYGRFKLVYTYDGKHYTNAGNFLTVCRKENGEWKISNLIFNDPQPTVRDLVVVEE